MSLEPRQDATAIARAAERLVCSLVGIEAAIVCARADGAIDSILVTRARGVPAAHAVQNVRSALLAALGIAIDASRVLVAPMPDGSGRMTGRASTSAAYGTASGDDLHDSAGERRTGHMVGAQPVHGDASVQTTDPSEHVERITAPGMTNGIKARSIKAARSTSNVHGGGGRLSANGANGAIRNGIWPHDRH